MIQTRHGRPRGVPALTLALLMCSTLASPASVKAQTDDAILGATAGLAAGAWWTLSLTAARARSGKALFTPSDVLPAALPAVAVGLSTGLAIGIWGEDRLAPTVGWGLVGWASGFGLGYVVGDAIWEDDAGKWAGAVIGSGAGLAIGALLGGISGGDSDATPAEQQSARILFQHSIPIGR